MTQRGWFALSAQVALDKTTAPVEVRFGAGRVSEIGQYLLDLGARRVMLVTGPNVGADLDVMGLVRDSLEELATVEFLEVSRRKHISTIFEGVSRLDEAGADAIVGIGGGASLDTARQIATFAAAGRPASHYQEAVRRGEPPMIDPSDHAPVVLVPTTLAGADLSSGGSIEVLSSEESADGLPKRINPKAVAPAAVFYDPTLYQSTPKALLTGSAMNGLNKGIETVYAPDATPYSDAVAAHGVRSMAQGLLRLSDEPHSAMNEVVAGLILVQLERRISILHAFGHAVARHTPIQQGVAHALVTPHALKFLLSVTDLRRKLLADVLRGANAAPGVGDDGEAIVKGVTTIRDRLGLPATFGELGVEFDLNVLSEHVCADSLMTGSPLGRPLEVAEAYSVFEAAL